MSDARIYIRPFEETQWQEFAACRDDVDPNIFFPDKGENDVADEAKAICDGCPVRLACLAYSIKMRETHGIWGGLTERQRRPIRRERRDRNRAERMAS